MNPFKAKATAAKGPESIIQEKIITKLMRHGWHVEIMIGNAFQYGIPDLMVAHPKYGIKFIEVKNPLKFSFTQRQNQKFPVLHAAGIGIWVLFSDSDEELMKLFKPANWFEVWFKWSQGGLN